MTDRELLEFAAKAIGCAAANGRVYKLCGQLSAPRPPALLCDNDLYWAPLTDDGDALRLAVKLKLQLQIIGLYDDEVGCYDLGEIEHFEKHGDDPYAATRRAIVRAAAEIGKAME